MTTSGNLSEILSEKKVLETVSECGGDLLDHMLVKHDGDLYAIRNDISERRAALDQLEGDHKVLGMMFLNSMIHAVDEAMRQHKPYERDRLIAYLGDFADDYDLEGIEEDILWTDYTNGPRFGQKFVKDYSEEKMWSVIESHQLSA